MFYEPDRVLMMMMKKYKSDVQSSSPRRNIWIGDKLSYVKK